MKGITPERVALFIVVMAVVAFLVYLPFHWVQERRHQAVQQEQREAQKQAAATRAAEEHTAALQMRRAAEREAAARAAKKLAAYQVRYLNQGFRRPPGLKAVAIAAEFEDHEPDRTIAVALANRFSHENLALFTSFFKPAFYTGGLFDTLFAGSTGPIYKLQLTNTLDALLLAQESVQYSTNGANLDNILTANARLVVTFLPFDVMRREQTWTYLANGAGFSQTQARSNANKRLIKQIDADHSLSLLSNSANSQSTYP